MYKTSCKVVLNHFYRLRHDRKRTIIYSNAQTNEYSKQNKVAAPWMSKVHPIYPMIFSFMSHPIELNILVAKIAYFLDVTKVAAENIVIPFINQDNSFFIEYCGEVNVFPRNIIITEDRVFCDDVEYLPEQFKYEEFDIKQERLYDAPLGCVFMINNICATDCVYCYADKKTKNQLMPFERLILVIENARRLKLSDFFITGGEFFLYNLWPELLDVLILNNYKPILISTKLPLNELSILRFKDYNIPIQISLDAVDDNLLQTILNSKENYCSKIRSTIAFIDKCNITFQISTVLTKYNDNIDNLDKIYDFIKQFKNIRNWEIRLAFKSLYSREDFDTIKTDNSKINLINNWVKSIRESSNIPISWESNRADRYFKGKNGSRSFVGSRCSANFSNMVILPDGKVTICEQLYWNKEFIIGDLTTQSIEEVWNSERALKLAYPRRSDFREISNCKICSIFEECFAFQNRCVVDIIKGYGENNLDFPDHRCAKAPIFINELRHI